jgi:hypothetical protein
VRTADAAESLPRWANSTTVILMPDNADYVCPGCGGDETRHETACPTRYCEHDLDEDGICVLCNVLIDGSQ